MVGNLLNSWTSAHHGSSSLAKVSRKDRRQRRTSTTSLTYNDEDEDDDDDDNNPDESNFDPNNRNIRDSSKNPTSPPSPALADLNHLLQAPEAVEGLLPDSNLLKAIHTYASDFYSKALAPPSLADNNNLNEEQQQRRTGKIHNHDGVDDEETKLMPTEADISYHSMDETALIAMGILLEEMANGVIGETGDLAFTEAEGEGDGEWLTSDDDDDEADGDEDGDTHETDASNRESVGQDNISADQRMKSGEIGGGDVSDDSDEGPSEGGGEGEDEDRGEDESEREPKRRKIRLDSIEDV